MDRCEQLDSWHDIRDVGTRTNGWWAGVTRRQHSLRGELSHIRKHAGSAMAALQRSDRVSLPAPIQAIVSVGTARDQ